MSPSRPSIHDTDPDDLAPPSSVKVAEMDVVMKQQGREIESLHTLVGKLEKELDDRSRETKIDKIKLLEARVKWFEERDEAERLRAKNNRHDALRTALLLVFGGVASQIGMAIFTKLTH